MTEDNSDISDMETSDVITSDVTTLETLAALVVNTTFIEINGLGFKIRPITWKEEIQIDKAVEKLRDSDKPAQFADDYTKAREKMRHIIMKGLIEPIPNREAIENLPSGLFILLATAIDDLSSFTSKKE